MTNALVHIVTVVGAGGSRSQERVPRARVLWDSLHRSQPDRATPRDDVVAGSERRPLQVNRIHGDLEQPSRVGGCVRFHMA